MTSRKFPLIPWSQWIPCRVFQPHAAHVFKKLSSHSSSRAILLASRTLLERIDSACSYLVTGDSYADPYLLEILPIAWEPGVLMLYYTECPKGRLAILRSRRLIPALADMDGGSEPNLHHRRTLRFSQKCLRGLVDITALPDFINRFF